jgi:hypothetical protein
MFGGFEIGAERLFDDDPPPRAVLGHHAGAGELFGDRQECIRRGREIEQAVAAGLALGLELVELPAHRIHRGGILRISLDAGDAGEQLVRQRIVDLAGRELMQALHQALGELLAGHALAGDADHAKIIRQKVAGEEIVERRDHQAMGEVAGGAENDKAAGIGFVTVGHGAGLLAGLLRLAVAAEAGAHRGQDLLGKGMLLA